MFKDSNLRHWLVSMNDYARREPKVLVSALDDEMVCVDMEKFLRAHFSWFETKAEETVTNIATESAVKLYRYLNVEVLRNQETIDKHFLGFTNPIKCVVMGGTSTFHEFLQPLMHVLHKFPKFKVGNFLRVYVVPTTNSSLANLIAKKDHWYQRNIFIPFQINPLLPMLKEKVTPFGKVRRNFEDDLDALQSEAKPDGRIITYELLEKNLQSYISEAQKFIKLYIYKVRGVGKPTK